MRKTPLSTGETAVIPCSLPGADSSALLAGPPQARVSHLCPKASPPREGSHTGASILGPEAQPRVVPLGRLPVPFAATAAGTGVVRMCWSMLGRWGSVSKTTRCRKPGVLLSSVCNLAPRDDSETALCLLLWHPRLPTTGRKRQCSLLLFLAEVLKSFLSGL